MKHTESDTLTALADQLADQVIQLDSLGVPAHIGQAGFALCGMLYHAARHPEVASAPIPRMIADGDRMIATARDAIRRANGKP